MTTKQLQEDTTDKLMIHLAQSKAYMNKYGKKGLAWRVKESKQTVDDIICIDWAIDFLERHEEICIVGKGQRLDKPLHITALMELYNSILKAFLVYMKKF